MIVRSSLTSEYEVQGEVSGGSIAPSPGGVEAGRK
jgi:hypothetical protein